MSNLKRHAKIHTQENPYKCSQCNKSFTTKSNLERHTKVHTGKILFQCRHCDKKFKRNIDLESHNVIHTGEKPYLCSLCDMSFTENSDLQEHFKIHPRENSYQCSNFDESFDTNNSLIKHNATHTGEKLHQCNQFDQDSSNLSASINANNHIMKPIGKRAFSDTGIENPHTSYKHCQSNIAKHTLEGEYQCTSLSVDIGATYANDKNSDSSFSCPECSFKCNTKYKLRKHLVSHKMLICPFCQYCCKNKGRMNLHMKDHTGESPFSCSDCGAGFIRKNDLDSHMQQICDNKNIKLPGIQISKRLKTTCKDQGEHSKQSLVLTNSKNDSSPTTDKGIDTSTLTYSKKLIDSSKFKSDLKIDRHLELRSNTLTENNEVDHQEALIAPISLERNSRIYDNLHSECSTAVHSNNSPQLDKIESILVQSQTNDIGSIENLSPNSENQNQNCDINCLHCIELIRKDHHSKIAENNFDTNLFTDNPLIMNCGRDMYIELEKTKWTNCIVCKENHICFPLDDQGKCEKCRGSGVRSKIFGPENDLDPGPAPECLTRLTPVEKSAISIICPSLTVVKCGSSSSKTRGHAISFYQNVQDLADTLPRLPKDLPYLILKHPDERIADKTFKVRRQYLIEALQFLVKHSEDYKYITISEENCSSYPENDIIQNLPQIHSKDFKMPPENPSADNPESILENASTVDMPFPINSVLENMESAIGENVQQSKQDWPSRSSCPVSEFSHGFFSKAFPTLFPYGKGDITKPRLGKNPTMSSYILHLLRLYRRFVTHHCFIFVCTNILRRHLALTLGNVFTKNSASDISMSELKQAISANDDKIIKQLLYFSAPIPGTRQDLRYQSDKAISIIRYVGITSQNKRFFNVFHTVSAADVHWNDLHRLLPGSEAYLNKIVVDSSNDIPIDEDPNNYIDKATDYMLRTVNLRKYPDIVVTYLHHRIHTMLKFFWKPLGLQEYIIRYEAQNRGTIHAHMLLSLEKGISNEELQKAFRETNGEMPVIEKVDIEQAKKKLIEFSVNTVGITAMHPNPDPKEWPSPYGSNVYCPPQNCLRQRFLDIIDMKSQYENLVNRVMIHDCRNTCFKNKGKKSGDSECRFGMPMDPSGFNLIFDESGKLIISANRNNDSPLGADVVDKDLVYIRNNPATVHHIAELLTVWCGNVETRTVKSMESVIRYILYYMVKPEPNSPPFDSILKSVIDVANENEAVRKVMQRILMKTVGEHDLSLQECLHILNGYPIVEFSRKFIPVNVAGTRRIRKTGNDTEPASVSNLADMYWGRNTNKHYNKFLNDFMAGKTDINPINISLYEFVSNYTKTWKYHGNGYVPHITPNFQKIPKKTLERNNRYIMFIKTIVLVHKAGCTYDEVESLDIQQLEIFVRNFVHSNKCPEFIVAEYEKSQNSENNDDESNDPINNDDPLNRNLEPQEISNEQDEIMSLMRTYHIDENITEIEDGSSMLLTDQNADWEQDYKDLNFTDVDIQGVATWVERARNEDTLMECSQDNEPAINMNRQQINAFAIVKNFIDSFADPNRQQVNQLLLQINGPPGSGKSYWIQKVKAYARSVFQHNDFVKFVVQTAAPSGTAAFLIKGETLHSLLMLPVDYNSYKPLSSDRLYGLQQKFKNIGVLILDEKSMVGQRLFHMADMRLREIYPHKSDINFGGLSLILIGDWKQLPPVGDSSLFDNKSKCPAGFNLYSEFKDVITFSKIERQTGESQKQFREELERLGAGKFTVNDWKKWKSRTFDQLSPAVREEFNQNAILACSEKKNMIQHNLEKVKANNQPIAVIHAVSNCKAAKQASSDKACGLLSELVVSKNSVVRLTANLWTKAGLTNGAKGIVRGIIYAPNSKPPALPICLIVSFEKYYGPSFIESIPKSVPICPIRREWFSQEKSCSRRMLPLILGYALSIHKLQGETLEKVILDIGDKEFQTGLTFVGATRVKTFQGLAFKPFPNYDRFEQIRNSPTLKKRIKEEERLEELHQRTLCKYNDIIESCIYTLNWMD